jgi:hypothetical protein
MANDITSAGDSATPAVEKVPRSIYLVSYPKIVYLYPSLLAALVCGAIVLFSGNQDFLGNGDTEKPAAEQPAENAADNAAADEPAVARNETAEMTTLVFLVIFGANLIVLSFDFPRTTSLTFFFVGVAVFLGIWLLANRNPNFLPVIGSVLKEIRPYANAQFYFIFAGVVILIYIAVAISAQFDYWEVRPNELLHHHGVLSDMKRYSAPNLRIDMEINDLFEYLLLRAGRLILHPSNERMAIVLENVFFISKKEQQITKMLGALQVQVRTEGEE